MRRWRGSLQPPRGAPSRALSRWSVPVVGGAALASGSSACETGRSTVAHLLGSLGTTMSRAMNGWLTSRPRASDEGRAQCASCPPNGP